MTTLRAASSSTSNMSGPGAHRAKNADPPSRAGTPTKTRRPHAAASVEATYRPYAPFLVVSDDDKDDKDLLLPPGRSARRLKASSVVKSPETHAETSFLGASSSSSSKSAPRKSARSLRTLLLFPARRPRGERANLTSSRRSFCGATRRRPTFVAVGAKVAALRAARAAEAPSRSSELYSRLSFDTAAFRRSKSSIWASTTAVFASLAPKALFSFWSLAPTKNKSDVPLPARPVPAP
mmetsp:Transcript_26206/g.84827  ORF Transcript_26206/g.84827 Transcript_26206/m.84827 type:complete len:237 (-) Transcript_26206:2193-2903(-)